MGFLDKLKDAGKKAVVGAVVASQPECAFVTKGKHALCKIAVDNTAKNLLFIKAVALEEQCEISEKIKTVTLSTVRATEDIFCFVLHYVDGETSDIKIKVDHDCGSALPTAEERLAAQYKNAANLVYGLGIHVKEIPQDTFDTFNLILRYASHKELTR